MTSGVCAAKADGKVEDAEIAELESISALLGQEQSLKDAYSYVELFQENDDAISLAITALEKSQPVAKLAAVLLMENVLAHGDINKEEDKFYQRVMSKISI